MEFFPTLPPQAAVRIRDRNLFMQAHHLQHLTADSQEMYCFRKMANALDEHIILDNGAWELKQPACDALYQVLDKFNPACHRSVVDEVVCPDVFQDKAATLEMMDKHMHDLMNRAKQVMLVPQGQTIIEWTGCLLDMRAYAEASWTNGRIVLGIPKVVETYSGGRYGACCWMEDHPELVPAGGAHLLGVWAELDEIIALRDFPFIRSIDTTMPYAWALAGIVLQPHKITPFKSSLDEKDWNHSPTFAELRMTEINIAVMRRLCR